MTKLKTSKFAKKNNFLMKTKRSKSQEKFEKIFIRFMKLLFWAICPWFLLPERNFVNLYKNYKIKITQIQSTVFMHIKNRENPRTSRYTYLLTEKHQGTLKILQFFFTHTLQFSLLWFLLWQNTCRVMRQELVNYPGKK